MSDEQRTYYALTLGQGIAVDEIYEGDAEVEEKRFRDSVYWTEALQDVAAKANALIFIGDNYVSPLGDSYYPVKADREAAVPGKFCYSFMKGNRVNPTEVTVIKVENLNY